jgi:hypothetical protein
MTKHYDKYEFAVARGTVEIAKYQGMLVVDVLKLAMPAEYDAMERFFAATGHKYTTFDVAYNLDRAINMFKFRFVRQYEEE